MIRQSCSMRYSTVNVNDNVCDTLITMQLSTEDSKMYQHQIVHHMIRQSISCGTVYMVFVYDNVCDTLIMMQLSTEDSKMNQHQICSSVYRFRFNCLKIQNHQFELWRDELQKQDKYHDQVFCPFIY